MNRIVLRLPASVGWLSFLGTMTLLGTSGDPNLVHVATLMAIWSLWGASLNIVWGYAGQFSMAQVGLGAVSAYVAAVAVGDWGLGAWAALGVALVATVAVSVVIGLASLRLTGFYFAIMTLAFSLLFLSIVRSAEVFGRTMGISTAFELGTLSIGGLSWNLDSYDGGYLALVVAVLVIVLVATGRLERTRSGRAFTALREDDLLSASIGIRPASYRVLAFAVSAIPAGLAGYLYAGYLRYITPGSFGFAAVVTLVVQLVLGGRGHRFGPVAGAMVYIGVTEWARFGGDYREAMFGLILVVIVLFAPQGLLGGAGDLVRLVRPRGRPEPGPEEATADPSLTSDALDAPYGTAPTEPSLRRALR